MGMRTGAQEALLSMEHAVSGNANSISLCSGILREIFTKTSIDFSMSSSRLMAFLQPPALLWMIHTYKHQKWCLRDLSWVSGSVEILNWVCHLNFALIQWSLFFFSVLLRHKYISHTYISIVHNILFYFIFCHIWEIRLLITYSG